MHNSAIFDKFINAKHTSIRKEHEAKLLLGYYKLTVLSHSNLGSRDVIRWNPVVGV